MTFHHTWVLAIAWLPLAWMFVEWQRTARKLGLALKAITFTLILLALSEPRLDIPTTRVAVGVVVDTSASVSGADLERASRIASGLNSNRGRHWMRLIPFPPSTPPAHTSQHHHPRTIPLPSRP